MGGAIDLIDRIRGCILLGAFGDAIGAPYEGAAGPISYRDPDRPWAISDDTQLTLATCEAICETGTVSPESIAAKLVEWFRTRRFTGLGASTLKALRDLDAGAHWALAGAKGERAAGAGAAARVAPLAFLLDPADETDRQTLRDICRITHHNEEAYVGSLAVHLAIRMAANQDVAPDEWFLRIAGSLPDSVVRDRMLAIGQAPRGTALCKLSTKFGASGYVAEAVPLAIYAACSFQCTSPIDVLRKVVEAGGDTDTIAAIAGQILGARNGARSITEGLINALADAELIFAIANRFAVVAVGLPRPAEC
jgi:ADP-ribosylglycohydrolase